MTDSLKNYSPYRAEELAMAQEALARFVETVSKLRNPDGGCPWDVKQTHASLRSFMIEEAYEAAEAMAHDDPEHLCEELGDVLLQVVLNAQVAKDKGWFALADVIAAVDAKMIERHPHVFAPGDSLIEVADADDVKTQWEMIKAAGQDKAGGKAYADKMAKLRHPANHHSVKIGKYAAKANFDWSTAEEVLAQLKSEITELEQELAKPARDEAALHSEIGDVYFCLAQLCRHIKADPELIAAEGNQKFIRRFTAMEEQLKEHYQLDDIHTIPVAEKEQFWQKVKRQQRGEAEG